MLAFLMAACTVLAHGQSTPEELWDDLAAGNRRFVEGSVEFNDLKDQRAHTRDHQSPPVTVLACADSRVPPELVFDESIGELFVIRIAGNTADAFGLASIEYAIAHDFTKLIVVLGHENCGAVKAALSPDDPGSPSLLALVQRIRAAFIEPPPSTVAAVEANARAAAALLSANSRIVRDAVRGGRVKVVPAYYELSTGKVRKIE